MKNYDFIKAWVFGEIEKGYLRNLSIASYDKRYLKSYSTPIAFLDGNRNFGLVTDDWYSITTQIHKNLVECAFHEYQEVHPYFRIGVVSFECCKAAGFFPHDIDYIRVFHLDGDSVVYFTTKTENAYIYLKDYGLKTRRKGCLIKIENRFVDDLNEILYELRPTTYNSKEYCFAKRRDDEFKRQGEFWYIPLEILDKKEFFRKTKLVKNFILDCYNNNGHHLITKARICKNGIFANGKAIHIEKQHKTIYFRNQWHLVVKSPLFSVNQHSLKID